LPISTLNEPPSHAHEGGRLFEPAVLFVSLSVAFSLIGDQALYAILPVHFETLGLTSLQVGVLLSINRWVRLLTNHAPERMVATYGASGLLVVALGVGAMTTGACALFPTFLALLVARAFWGCCWSFIRQIGVMTCIDVTPHDRLARVMGVFNGVFRTGSILGCLGGALLFDAVGFRMTLGLFAGVSLLGIPCALLGRGHHGRHMRARMPRVSADATGSVTSLMVRGFVAGCAGPGLVASTLGYLLRERLGEGGQLLGTAVSVTAFSGFVLACRHVINTIGAGPLGVLIDRFGRLRGERVACVCAAVSLACAGVLPGVLFPVLGVLVFFTASTAMLAVLPAEAGGRGGKAYARYATALDLGAATGPLVGWTMIQTLDMPSASLLLASVLYCVALGVSVRRTSGPGQGRSSLTSVESVRA